MTKFLSASKPSLWRCVLGLKTAQTLSFLDILVASSHLFFFPSNAEGNPGPCARLASALPLANIPTPH